MANALILAFAALLFIALLALLWSRWPAWMKALLVMAVSALYFLGHHAVHSIWGVPSSDALPERFVLLGAAVEEPNARAQGAIYLWVSELREGAPTLAPRAYRVPYSKPLHQQVEEGVRRGRDGTQQMGTAQARAGSGRGVGWLQPGADEQAIRIRDLPAPQLPEK